MEIGAKEKTLCNLSHETSRLTIDIYQREFNWTVHTIFDVLPFPIISEEHYA